MGFHPETGEELRPITKEIVEKWKNQSPDRRPADRPPPRRVDHPETFAFFDPLTGEPRAWYWRGVDGAYEFYDSPGYQPRTGEKLSPVTQEIVNAYEKEKRDREREQAEKEAQEKRDRAEREAKERREQAEKEAQEKRERAERVEKERRERAEKEERERRERAEREAKERIAQLCDQLAANPTDPRRSGDGVPYELLKSQARQAIENCDKAAQQNPRELRFQYQLGRALQFTDRKRAMQIHEKLCQGGLSSSIR
jgi:hypothetical protein